MGFRNFIDLDTLISSKSEEQKKVKLKTNTNSATQDHAKLKN